MKQILFSHVLQTRQKNKNQGCPRKNKFVNIGNAGQFVVDQKDG